MPRNYSNWHVPHYCKVTTALLSQAHWGPQLFFLEQCLFLFPSFLWKSEAASIWTRPCVKICPDACLPRVTAIPCLASPQAPFQQGAHGDKAEFLPCEEPALISLLPSLEFNKILRMCPEKKVAAAAVYHDSWLQLQSTLNTFPRTRKSGLPCFITSP